MFAHGLVGGSILEGYTDIPLAEPLEVGAVANEEALLGQGPAHPGGGAALGQAKEKKGGHAWVERQRSAIQTLAQEIAFPVKKGAGVFDEVRHCLPVSPEKTDCLLGQAVDAPGLHETAKSIDNGRVGHEESGPQAGHAEDLRHRPEDKDIVEAVSAHAFAVIHRHKGQVGFVDDEANLTMDLAEAQEMGMGDQLAGGVVGIAEKHCIVSGKRRFQPFQVRGKAVVRFGHEKIGLDIVHPAAVGIIGIGRADDQYPSGSQGSTGGIDELGGAAAGQDPLRRNTEQGGNGVNRRPPVDFGQDLDPIEPRFEMID